MNEVIQKAQSHLDGVRVQRSALVESLHSATSAAVTEKRGLTDAETGARETLRSQIAAVDVSIEDAELRVADLTAQEVRTAAAGIHAPRAAVQEPDAYRKRGPNSFFRDLIAVTLNGPGAHDAGTRLSRSHQDTITAERRAGVTVADGAAGFAAPQWLWDEAIKLARPGRPTANLCRPFPFASGTPSVNLPRVVTGTGVDVQTEGEAATEDDPTTDDAVATTQPLAGLALISQQTLDQTGGNFDEIVAQDLMLARAARLDDKVLNSTATGAKGLLNVTGVNDITFTALVDPTDGTFTADLATMMALYRKIAAAQAAVLNNIFLPADAIIMSPTRWAWWIGAVDNSGRPIAPATGAYNPVATIDGPVTEGLAGGIQGLPVYLDAQIPTDLGGTGGDPGTQDAIIVLRTSEVGLAEGGLRTEVFRETHADTLQVLFRLFGYHQLHSARRPKAISVISGTGLVSPTL